MGVYLYSDEWLPGENTLLYCEFEGNGNDLSGNGRNMTTSSNISYVTVGGQQVVNLTSTQGGVQFPGQTLASIGTGDFTISFWLKPMSPSANKQMMLGIWKYNESPYYGPQIILGQTSTTTRWRMRGGSSPVYVDTGGTSIESGNWHHWVMTRGGGVVYCYVDGVLLGQFNSTDACPSASETRFYFLGRWDETLSYASSGTQGDKLIVENVNRVAEKVVDYYNNTKSIYQN